MTAPCVEVIVTSIGPSGSPVSGLLTQLNGLVGLKGWQWMFLIEALPALVLTPIVLTVLSDKPGDASWLSVPERDWLTKQLAQEPRQTSTSRMVFSI